MDDNDAIVMSTTVELRNRVYNFDTIASFSKEALNPIGIEKLSLGEVKAVNLLVVGKNVLSPAGIKSLESLKK